MKIKKTSSKTKVAIVVIALLIVGGSAAAFALRSQPKTAAPAQTPNTVNYGQPTTEQEQNGADIKSKSLTGSAQSGSDTPPTPTPTSGSTKKTASMEITALNTGQSSLQVRVQIDAVDDSGNCTLTLSQNGTVAVTQTAGTQSLASTSTCRGFDVSNVPAGSYTLAVTYDSSSLTGSVSRQNVTVP